MRLFTGRAYPELADEVAYELGIPITPTSAYDFANGEIFIRFEESVRGSDAFVLQSHSAPVNKQIMEQLIMVDALKRAGLDHDTVSARNPRLVYGQITGYGLEGPDANRPGYDIAAFWARSGIAHMLTPDGGALPFQRGGMGDHTTGVTFAGAISAALYQRERSGLGQMVSSSLLRQGVYTIGFDLNMMLGWGQHPMIGQRTQMMNPSVNNYQAGDGKWFWVVGLEGERHWPPLARVAGHPEWITDERFVTPLQRAINHKELIALLDEAFSGKSLDEWADIFATEPDMFWSPVNSAEEVLADPQLRHAGGLIEVFSILRQTGRAPQVCNGDLYGG